MTLDARPEIHLPRHMSHSQASSILKYCGWAFVLERGFHVPSVPSWATVGGGAVHYATEVWDNWTVAGEWVTDRAEIEKLWTDAFDKEIAERLEREPEHTTADWRASGRASKAWPEKENEAWWRFHGGGMVMSWVTWRQNNMTWELVNLDGKPGIELEVKTTLGGVEVVGYVDRLFHRNETELLTCDLKSGRAPDSGDQLGGYGIGLEDTYGVTPTWGCYWMARTGAATEFEDMRLWPRERLEDIYRKAAAIKEQGLFLPKESSMCNSCSVKDFCLARNGKFSDDLPKPWEVTVAKHEPVSS